MAESYVVAATCYETLELSTVTAISSGNLEKVGIILRNKYPNSQIIIMGDNDRHLMENTGIKAANRLKERLRENCTLAIPDFEGFPATKDYSDWNDLLREKGHEIVKNLLAKILGF